MWKLTLERVEREAVAGGGGGGEQGKGEAGQYSPPRHEARTNKMLRLTNLRGG